jgi:hypothetical protein
MKNGDLIKRIENIQNKAKSILVKIDILRKYNNKKFISLKKVILESEKQISENFKLIEEQNSILNDLNEIKEKRFENFSVDLLKDMNYDTILELTQNKEIDFDENHPYYNNVKFIKDLMDYYISLEEYEECSNLQRLVY